MKKINKEQKQRSFYFNEYNQKNLNEKKDGLINIDQDRIYLIKSLHRFFRLSE